VRRAGIIATILGTVASKRLEVPDFAKHQSHVAQGDHVERQEPAFDLIRQHLDCDIVAGDRNSFPIMQPLRAAPRQTRTVIKPGFPIPTGDEILPPPGPDHHDVSLADFGALPFCNLVKFLGTNPTVRG
jgi:hypothetical protein